MTKPFTCLTVCLLLMPASDTASHAQTGGEATSSLVVLISGFGSDPSPQQLANSAPRGHGNSGMYQLAGDLRDIGFKTHFFNWNGTAAGHVNQQDAPGTDGIVASIRAAHSGTPLKRLVIIGHSWGGHTMLEVAEELKTDPQIEICLAIGVDASSLSRGPRPEQLPSTIQSFVNFHTRNSFVWGDWPGDDRAVNVDLGDPANGYAAHGPADYAAIFDITAHNAAEWDQRIHKDIVHRIKRLADEPTDYQPEVQQPVKQQRNKEPSC